MITKFYLTVLLLIVCLFSTAGNKYVGFFERTPFKTGEVKQPRFPLDTLNIIEFGGIGDGTHLNTEAFQKAINTASKIGGGTLLIPSGIWLTGPIELKSNVEIHLQDRAIILFSSDKDLYPIVETSFEGLDTRRCQSPISGKYLVNIAITGSGAIDGSGDSWRPVKKQKVTENHWKKIISQGGVFKRSDYWMPSASYLHADTISDMNVPKHFTSDREWYNVRDFLRPVMVSLQHCKNVYLKGIIFQNSPAWNIHPLMCENLIIDNIEVRNPSYAQNGDGLDIESCKNVLVINSSFDVGDDGICIKAGKDEDGRNRAIPCENVIIDNCTVYRGHGGFVVGSEMSAGVRNIIVSNCQFLGTDVGLRFKSKRGRGGLVENIFIENISMIDIATEPIHFNLYYGGKSVVEDLDDDSAQLENYKLLPPVDETTPAFQDIFIKNINCSKARRAFYFCGLPERKINNIRIENLTVHCQLGGEIYESENIELKNINIFPQEGLPLMFNEVKNIFIDGELMD